MINPIRNLPPGVDSIDQDVTFGSMWIKAGTLKLIRTSKADYNLLCQFWGQSTPAILSLRSDTPHNEQLRTQKYNIKCPITFFAEYLQQMKNHLKLEVQQVGKVSFDITKFMKKNINIDSKQAFDHFKGFFEIFGKGNRKAGLIQIQMGCQFDPQIAIKQLGQQAIQKIRESQIQNCPSQKLPIKSCCGHCICICPKYQHIQQNKQPSIQQKNYDTRIPHSLDIKPREQSQFNYNKYQNQDIQKKIQKSDDVDIKENIIDQIQQKQLNINQNDKKGSKQFPEVPSILTYSNLRLNYEQPQLQNQFINPPQQQPEQKQVENIDNNQEQQQLKQNQNQEQNIQNIYPLRYQTKPKPQTTNEDLMKQFYGSQNCPLQNFIYKSKSQISQPLESQRNKLSKVINLDKQFKQNNIEIPSSLAPPTPPIQKTTNSPRFNYPNIIKDNIVFLPQKQQIKKPSNLMLSLFIEIDKNSIKLPTKQNYIIAYRVYGQKQRLTLGPHFDKIINIINLIGQNQIKKMGKIPFILQFWSSINNKFIGLIKLNLNKIKNGFLLQDRLNQIAIKTNILPTTIYKGQISIFDLSDQQVGACHLYASVGTSNQLNTYLNQKQQKIINKDIKKDIYLSKQQYYDKPTQEDNKKPQIHIDLKNILNTFDIFLDTLYKNNNIIIDTLNMYMNQRWLNKQQFNQITKMIGLNSSLNNIIILHQQVSSKKDMIDFHHIAQSFDDFIEIIQQIKNDLQLCSKTLRNIFSTPETVLNQINQQTPMKVISKKKLDQILQKYSKFDHPIIEYLNKFNQYINLDYIKSTLMNKPITQPDLIQINRNYINQIISQRICTQLLKNGFTIDRFQQYLQNINNIDIISFFKWINSGGNNASLWGIMHWMQMINLNTNNESNFQNVDKLQFINSYLAICEKLNKPTIMPQQKNIIISQPQNKPYQQVQKKTISLTLQNNLTEPHQKQEIKQISIKNEQEHQLQDPEQHEQNQRQDQTPLQLIQHETLSQKQLEQQPQQNLYKHLLSIQPIQLTLDNPIKGNCEIVYNFPFDDEQIKSKNFITSIDKHKYPLKMYATHGFTIQQSAQSYLADNSIKFYVKINNKIQFEGAVPSDQILIQPNTEQTKIIPLFSEHNDGIAGKIKLIINYEKIKASQSVLGKQTTFQLYLPKSGYINFSVSCELQPSKIRSQLNIKQQFYIALMIDIFHHSLNLKQLIPPISSKLYSDSSQNVQLLGNIKISLSPLILEYLKSNTARLSLNIIYYSKDSANFERKEVPFAIIQLPLMNIVKAQGIKGDYAFKNKLGMYVTLAHVEMKYSKDSLVKTSIKNQPNPPKIAYWLILNFLQLINFETTKSKWVKMEFVLKGHKYSTQKQSLQPFSVNQLRNASILIKFNEQDFIDTKVIPITITTNLPQKLAIDINLKAITKDLIQKKYSINNQYYIIVNQQSRATKMRIGLKTYCFRGGPLLSNFINALYQNLDMQIFNEMNLPQQIDNYQQMLKIFKNKLKLPIKQFQQSLTQICSNTQKLNFEFFTNKINYKLDFTPILAQNQNDIIYICQQLLTETTKQSIINYINNNKIQLINFRQEFLDRYYFKQLNKNKIDKNVQFLSIQHLVDLIVFVRKIKLISDNQRENQNYMKKEINISGKKIQISVLEGENFNQLYNGIKPNSIVRLPELGIQTRISHRNSNPHFNEQFQANLNSQNGTILRNLKIEVFHCTSDDEDAENILIGQGYAKLIPKDLLQSDKIIKVNINSTMSNKSKANLNIKVGLRQGQTLYKNLISQNSEKLFESAQANRFGQLIHNIHQQMKYKNQLFQSSDDDL